MKEKENCALRPPKSARGGKRKLAAIFMAFLMIGMTSCYHYLGENEVQAVYRYTIKAYYLDGGSRVITMKGFFSPKVQSYKGSYWLETFYGYDGSIRMSEPAVCRYDLLHKEDITEEYYGRKIVSSEVDGNIVVHTLEQKGGAL